MLVIITGTLFLVDWHTKNFAYRCPSCGGIFEVSTLENFLEPDGVNKKHLICPKCRK
jgi:ribosomal protein S27AE